MVTALGIACNVAAPSAPPTKFDASEAVNPDTQPIHVSMSVDESHSASSEIGPEGGTLSTTGADGTRFTLEIPKDALVETVNIRMTPISSFDGIPWKNDGLIGAVQLEPDGQTFYSYVSLTIQPAADIPADQIVPVGASGAGQDLYMPIIDPKSRALVLKLDHFSSAGATKGLLADTEPWRQRLGGDVEDRLSTIMNQEIDRARQNLVSDENGPLLDPAFTAWFIATWKKEVLQPRLEAAKENCAAGRLAIESILGMWRLQELLGDHTDLGTNVSDLFPTVGKVCIQEEYELCRDQHIIHRMLPALVGLTRQSELLGLHELSGSDVQRTAIEQVETEGWDLARKCLQFQVQFESNATMGTGDGSFTSKVEATVDVKLDPSGQQLLEITGSGPLDNTEYDFKPNVCTATGITGGGTFHVLKLNWVDAPPDANYPYGQVTAIHLTYDPGDTSESAKVTCSGALPVTIPPSPMWTMAFEALHMDEMVGSTAGQAPPLDLSNIFGGANGGSLPGLPGGFTLPGAGSSGQAASQATDQGSGLTFTTQEWAVRGGELFAQKEWQTSVNMTTTGSEEGWFKLYHKPQ